MRWSKGKEMAEYWPKEQKGKGTHTHTHTHTHTVTTEVGKRKR